MIKTVELSEEDLRVLQCIVDIWDLDGGLWGGISYAMVANTLDKLGIQHPASLTAILDGSFEIAMQKLFADSERTV